MNSYIPNVEFSFISIIDLFYEGFWLSLKIFKGDFYVHWITKPKPSPDPTFKSSIKSIFSIIFSFFCHPIILSNDKYTHPRCKS